MSILVVIKMRLFVYHFKNMNENKKYGRAKWEQPVLFKKKVGGVWI